MLTIFIEHAVVNQLQLHPNHGFDDGRGFKIQLVITIGDSTIWPSSVYLRLGDLSGSW